MRKFLAVSLAAAMLAGTGFTAAGSYVGTSVSVSAAETYGDFQYSVNNDNTVSITGYTGNGGDVVIPDTIDGNSVTEIAYQAFYGCTGLTIYGTKDSRAETYANENNIPFVAILSNKSTISANEIALGQTVTVNAKASEDNCTYSVLYKKKTQSKWTTAQDFGTNAAVSVKPAQATDYDICIKVKDKDGTIVKKYFTVTVTK